MLLRQNTLRLAMSAVVVAVVGCGPQDEIARYTATKPELVDPTLVARSVPVANSAAEQQTIGLIVPVGKMGWFFKLTGDLATVAAEHENFVQFATSLTFTEGTDPKPQWKLPPGWKETPGSQMRFATIQIASEGKLLELSVIPLPIGDNHLPKYVLDNVNRWRQQLSLAAITAEELASTSKSLTIDGHQATLVSLVGKGSGGMGQAPFAPFAGGQLPPDHPPIGDSKPATNN